MVNQHSLLLEKKSSDDQSLMLSIRGLRIEAEGRFVTVIMLVIFPGELIC